MDRTYPIATGDDIMDPECRRVMREGCIVMMPPFVYLALCPAPPWWEGYNDSYYRLRARLRAGEPIDIPYIRVWIDRLGHEGRHRALAALDLGFECIPVGILKEIPSEEELKYLESIETEA